MVVPLLRLMLVPLLRLMVVPLLRLMVVAVATTDGCAVAATDVGFRGFRPVCCASSDVSVTNIENAAHQI